ncbi:MAG TPA: hypothetical protein VGE44_14580 [Daejeonella sp.]|uniref:hypothetical protein n=1 Tax=Daejeonella sp. TaxID=2805397 RepID=UPI002EDAFEAF
MENINLNPRVKSKDLLIDPSQHVICSDLHCYNLSKDAHISFTRLLNETMTEFTEATGQVITDEEFDIFLHFDISRMQNLYSNRVTKKCENIFPESLRKERENGYYQSNPDFFPRLRSRYEHSCRIKNTQHFDLRRIRFVEGKAVFTDDDADLLLREKFSTDLTDPKMKALMLEFQKLSQQYEKFRKFLEENTPLYGVNPSNEPLIGSSGQFIDIHPAKNPQMSLNPNRLSVISNANTGRFLTDLTHLNP